MPHRRGTVSVLVPTLVALSLLLPVGSVRASVTTRRTASTCSSAWTIVSSGNVGRQSNALSDVSALSATDAWAVGYYAPGSITKPLIEHWDGESFKVVASAAISGRSMLNGVAAVSTSDAWAVGFVDATVLIEHWDGAAWARVSTLVKGGLSEVAAISSEDVWAVGSYGTKAITMHWDGHNWTRVRVDLPDASLPLLLGVSGVASDDVWAVGSFNDHGLQATLALHWDGSRWTQVDSPNPPPPDSSNYLRSVDAAGPNDVWAAGYYVGATRLGLMEHWDGFAWTVSTIPEPTASPELSGIGASSGSEVWAVGDYVPPFPNDHVQTLTEAWDGVAWAVVPSPNVDDPARHNFLIDVDVLSDGTAIAVGYYSAPNDPTYQTLVEEICP